MATFDENTSPYCYYFDALESLENCLETMLIKNQEGINFINTHPVKKQQNTFTASMYLTIFNKLKDKILDLQIKIMFCMDSFDSPRGIDTEKLDKKIKNYSILTSKIQETLNRALTQGYDHYKKTEIITTQCALQVS